MENNKNIVKVIKVIYAFVLREISFLFAPIFLLSCVDSLMNRIKAVVFAFISWGLLSLTVYWPLVTGWDFFTWAGYLILALITYFVVFFFLILNDSRFRGLNES